MKKKLTCKYKYQYINNFIILFVPQDITIVIIKKKNNKANTIFITLNFQIKLNLFICFFLKKKNIYV